jgi:hypothetical protein
MLKPVWLALILSLASMNAVMAQESAVERTLPTTSGMSIIAWIFIALIIAAGVVWAMRSRRGRGS